MDAKRADVPVLLHTLKGHAGAIESVRVAPGADQMATGGADGRLFVYHVSGPSKGRAFKFSGHTGPIHDVQFAPGSDLIASASGDRSIRIWRNSV